VELRGQGELEGRAWAR
jgi:hypothetical protein